MSKTTIFICEAVTFAVILAYFSDWHPLVYWAVFAAAGLYFVMVYDLMKLKKGEGEDDGKE